MQIIKPVSVADAQAALTRASTATYWDKTGTLQTAVANALRVSYDPSDLGAAPKPLIEPAATNLCGRSVNLNLTWASYYGMSPNGTPAVAPDGTVSAFGILPIVGSGATGLSLYYASSTVYTWTAGVTYCLSGFVKAGKYSLVSIGMNASYGAGFQRTFDISGASSYYGSDYGADYVGNGWFRVWVTITPSADSAGPTACFGISGGVPADSAAAFYMWGPQIEVGSKPSSYIPTPSGAAVTRAADTFSSATGAGLLMSNVVESDGTDGALWSAAATYTTGQTVRRPNHRRYYALQAVPANQTPENNTSGATPYWQDIGPTSTYSAFDATYSTVASAADYVTYILRPGQVCTGLAVVGMDATSVRVTMIDSATGVTVYDNPKALRLKNSRSISDYLFGEIEQRTDEVFDDLPPFKSAIITVTASKLGGTAKIGDVQFGRLEEIGDTQWKPEIRTLRRSLIEDDGFGNIKFTKRRSSKLITADVSVDSDRVDYVVRMLNAYTDTPCVIIGDARWSSLIVLGFVQDFRLVLENDGVAGALYNAQIQGFA